MQKNKRNLGLGGTGLGGLFGTLNPIRTLQQRFQECVFLFDPDQLLTNPLQVHFRSVLFHDPRFFCQWNGPNVGSGSLQGMGVQFDLFGTVCIHSTFERKHQRFAVFQKRNRELGDDRFITDPAENIPPVNRAAGIRYCAFFLSHQCTSKVFVIGL